MKLIFNKIFLQHNLSSHPENKNRLKYFFEEPETEITVDGEKYLSLAHGQEYIDLVKEQSKNNGSLDGDTYTNKRTYEAACKAVGASIMAAEQNAFALVRPPGHHAFADRGSGFCIFNNMAITVKYLLTKGKRVFIFDFDIHHGNGTQAILEGAENCFYISTHQSPCYPGSGLRNGKNYINIPLPMGTNDEDYIEKVKPILKAALEKFKPDIVGISAGFDSYCKDYSFMNPGVGFKLTLKSYEMIRNAFKGYKTFMLLEGGYNPESIKDGVEFFLKNFD